MTTKRNMVLKTVLWALWFSAYLAGCSDMFSTTSVTAKPHIINDYSLRLSGNKSIRYEVEEYLEDGAESDVQSLNLMNIEFKHISDTSFQGIPGAKIIVAAKSIGDGSQLWSKNMHVYFNDGQPETASFSAGPNMGPHLFHLGKVDSNNLSDFTNTLPILAEESEKIQFARNLFQITRQLAKTDTLKFKNRLEETWVVRETWTSQAETYMESTYWYGASGLLQCRQVYSGIREASSSGKYMGTKKFIREFRLR